ncbi:MAG: HD domain-containing protein [Chitinispirillaceae bacterium]|nr:HD domain-containing protein [Chitinispirillaceae bacterium]
MATEDNLLRIKTRFDKYVTAFYTGVSEHDSAIRIKEVHSRNVALEILTIADSLGCATEECYLAELSALLHDIGRFQQFRQYGTYRDCVSENHALLGVKALDETGIIADLGEEDRTLLTMLVRDHNRAQLPEHTDARFLFFLKLLRDADKIDIWRVVTEHYHGIATDDAIDIGLPDLPEISDRILHDVMSGRIARVEDIQTLNDFKLLQIGWVFDVNFPRSFEIIRHRKYVQKISAVLPQTDEVKQVVAVALDHVETHYTRERSVCECQIP